MATAVETLEKLERRITLTVPLAEVNEEVEKRLKVRARTAKFAGFRPGKAPRDMVVRKYEKDIADEVKRKLISESYREAVKEQKLDVVASDIEEIQFSRGQPLQFAATVETAPEFSLPEYKGLPVKREARTVTNDDMERALTVLREQQVSFNTVDRPAQAGDIAVVNYTGTIDGKPLTDIAPTAAGLTEKTGFWVEMQSGAFIPGFSDQLLGAKAGEKRTVNVDFPADFVTPQLAGRKGVYEVEVVEVKEKALPALDDAFAKSYGAESVEKLREGVGQDLENELRHTQDKSTQGQIVRGLLDRVNFELPESAVAQETKNVVYNLVRENQKRGLSRESIEKHKDEIYSVATRNAKERVKLAFLVQKIAEKEQIEVSREEMSHRIAQLAAVYQIPAEKFVKELQKRNGFSEVYEQLLIEKTIAFLTQNAVIEEVPPGSLSAAPR